jgi:hypothetical protein
MDVMGAPDSIAKYTQIAYILRMRAIFVELPAFQRFRSDYLEDDEYRMLQWQLLGSPEAGDIIKGTGGLRKLRFGDKRRGKGKRGGLRVIYYLWMGGSQFWMFTIYDKDEMNDLSNDERKKLADMLELEKRRRMPT